MRVALFLSWLLLLPTCLRAVFIDEEFRPAINNWVSAVVPLEDGRIIIGGYFTEVNGSPSKFLACLDSNGSNSAGFAAVVEAPVDGLLVHKGVLYVALSAPEKYVHEIRAYSLDGTLLRRFEEAYPGRRNFDIDSEGRLVWGQPRSHNALPALVRWPDPSFYPEVGCCGGNIVHRVLIRTGPDGSERIFAGGKFSSVGTNFMPNFVCLTTSGAIDTTFQSRGFPDTVSDIQMAGDQSIYVAGGPYIQRFLSDGTKDSAFNVAANRGINDFYTIQPLDAGGVLASSPICNAQCLYDRVRRYDSDGSLNTNFVIYANGSIGMAGLKGDSLLLFGSFTELNCLPRRYLVRVTGLDGPSDVPCLPPPPKPYPELSTSKLGRNWMICSWPTNYPEYQLQGTRRMRHRHPDRTKWITVTNVPVATEGLVFVTNKVARYGKHYRLVPR